MVVRPDASSLQISEQLKERLTSLSYEEDSLHPEVVFVVGGDGTFIYAVHQYIEQLDQIQFYGIHTGTFGFFTDYHDGDIDGFIETFTSGSLHEESYPLLSVKTSKDTYYAINEVRIENASRTQTMDIYLDDALFETYRGTGILVATQLGSTAYNRSLGGAVIQEGLKAIELTEIAGIHHNRYRSLGSSLVLKQDTKIQLTSEDFHSALLGVDADVYPIDEENQISIEIAKDVKVKMLKGKAISYFDRLHSLF